MSTLAKLSSKRQLTIPVQVFNKYFKVGEFVTIEERPEWIFLRRTRDVLQKLKGAIEIPARFKHKSIDEIIAQAKLEHFQNKNK